MKRTIVNLYLGLVLLLVAQAIYCVGVRTVNAQTYKKCQQLEAKVQALKQQTEIWQEETQALESTSQFADRQVIAGHPVEQYEKAIAGDHVRKVTTNVVAMAEN